MCSDNSPSITSPRISFSHNLLNTDDTLRIDENAYRADTLLLDSNSDHFDFSFSDFVENEPSSSADDLFSNGLIRPLQVKKMFKNSEHFPLPPLPNPPTYKTSKNEEDSSKEIIVSTNVIDRSDQRQQSKSFWRIKRSSSVHCDNSHKKSSFWSLPLLLRSNSTGSVPSSRQILKDNHKQNCQKQVKNSSSSSSSAYYVYHLSQKPPLKKTNGGAYGNGVWISPVLNMPPPYIAKGTANLFGLNSLFRDKKDKKNKK